MNILISMSVNVCKYAIVNMCDCVCERVCVRVRVCVCICGPMHVVIIILYVYSKIMTSAALST